MKKEKIIFKEINPFQFLFNSKGYLTSALVILLVVTFVASLASTAYDQNFNYYIKDIFNFKPSHNGYIKAATGIACLIVNMTIAIKIQQHYDLGKSLIVIFSICFMLLVAFVKIENIKYGRNNCKKDKGKHENLLLPFIFEFVISKIKERNQQEQTDVHLNVPRVVRSRKIKRTQNN